TPATNKWDSMAPLPGTVSIRGFATGFAINGKGYLFGGADATSINSDLWQYDAGTNKWTQMADIPGEARDGAFCFVIGNKAYVGGGNDSAGYLINDFWAYDPASNKWTQKHDLPDYTIFPFAFSIGKYGYISSGQQGFAE